MSEAYLPRVKFIEDLFIPIENESNKKVQNGEHKIPQWMQLLHDICLNKVGTLDLYASKLDSFNNISFFSRPLPYVNLDNEGYHMLVSLGPTLASTIEVSSGSSNDEADSMTNKFTLDTKNPNNDIQDILANRKLDIPQYDTEIKLHLLGYHDKIVQPIASMSSTKILIKRPDFFEYRSSESNDALELLFFLNSFVKLSQGITSETKIPRHRKTSSSN